MKPQRFTAREVIDTVFDSGSFKDWGVEPPLPTDPAYKEALQQARERSGHDESVITGEATVRGRRVALIASEFTFLAGSIGKHAAERIIAGIERATSERLPLVAATASGGTRMQEGTSAFVQMVAITAALTEHKAQGLPYFAYLRHPTTGGVFASWGSQAHLRVAQPGALVGFLGPRVYEALYNKPFPADVQTAENLAAHGLVDGVLPLDDLADVLDRALTVCCEPARTDVPVLPTDCAGSTDAWESVTISRNPQRPGVRAVLRDEAALVLPLHGTGAGEAERGLRLALVRAHNESFVLLAQDRLGQTPDEPLGAGALRQARRGMHLASELRLPLVTIIDTPGAALSKEAEEQGLASEIARCLADLVALDTPTVSVLLGQGTGGGAIALLPADVTICAKHAWLSPLPPEGAAAILYSDTSQAAYMASKLGISSSELLHEGIVDAIIDEVPDAADEPVEFADRVCRTIAAAVGRARLLSARAHSTSERSRHRTRRYGR